MEQTIFCLDKRQEVGVLHQPNNEGVVKFCLATSLFFSHTKKPSFEAESFSFQSQKGTIELNDVGTALSETSKGDLHAPDPLKLQIQTVSGKVWVLRAANHEELELWDRCLRLACRPKWIGNNEAIRCRDARCGTEFSVFVRRVSSIIFLNSEI